MDRELAVDRVVRPMLRHVLPEDLQDMQPFADRLLVTRAEALLAHVEIGRVLSEAKAACPHGKWREFLWRVQLPERTAQRMMQAAKAAARDPERLARARSLRQLMSEPAETIMLPARGPEPESGTTVEIAPAPVESGPVEIEPAPVRAVDVEPVEMESDTVSDSQCPHCGAPHDWQKRIGR